VKISSVPQAYRNLRRWREIARVLRRYGLADGLARFQLPLRDWAKDSEGIPLSSYNSHQRIRLALTELGPSFIKLGQLLATRPDLVGPKLADELKSLRADVKAEPFETVVETLKSQWGENYQSEFSEMSPVPLACASIGQVHRAKLIDGTQVVIKVQRSDIDRIVRQDIEILAGLAQLATRVETLAAWSPVELVEQFAPIMIRELDFNREGSHLTFFADIFEKADDKIVIPRPIERLCKNRVLVMQELIGVPLSTWTREQHDESMRQELGEKIASAYLTMTFEHSMFHADPHSGNLIVLHDGRLGILDFGMVGRIDQTLRESLEEMLMAVVEGDQHRLTRLIRRIGRAPATLDELKLSTDAMDFIANYSRQDLGSFDLTGALNDLSDILHRHGIKLPHQSALLLKMLISLEGTLGELEVKFDSLDVVKKLVRRSMLGRLSPARRMRQAKRIYLEGERFLETAPDELLSLISQTRRGEISLTLQHRRLSPSINRLVLGVMSSAVFLGSSVMMASSVRPLLFTANPASPLHNVSLLGLVGLFSSISVMLWLLIAINRSGHLTRSRNDEVDH
jgi:ubiquinone biosynthesis protein